MKSAADERQAEAKGEVGTNNAPCVQGSEAKECERAERTGPRGGEADLCSNGEHDKRKPSRRIRTLSEFGGRAEMPVDVPSRKKGDHDAECKKQPEIVG